MAEVKRLSGITVSVTGPAQLSAAAPPPKRDAKAPKRLAAGTPGDGGLILAALAQQDLTLVDSIPLAIPPAARPKKRGGAAPSSAVTLDVPLGPDEEAVILLEDEGEYRWIVDGKELGIAAPKRGAKRGAGKKQKRFSIELKAAPPPPKIAVKRGGVKRNWLVDKLVGKVTAFVFRFAVKVAGKKVVEILERKVEQGLVAITAVEPQQWQRLGDDAALPFNLPADRPTRVLLLVHGTFSSTVGSFGALGVVPQGRAFLARARSHYDAVIGFDHATLSVDPRKNAADLLARLRKVKWPQPPQFEIVAFSRGGLVARSLVEELLPKSNWGATVGRVVFVGCTNGGTQLAEPANWNRFADHYTNLALGATRLLGLIPGAQAVSLIAGGVIRGVGVLVKSLATGAITDKLVPGLAAMEPDGDFVTKLNNANGAAPDAQYFAIMSNFEPGKALASGTTPELPPKLLMRIADWGADELYGEANDLVVHVRSMTEICPGLGNLLRDKLDYGENGVVYHTNYFTRDTTADKLATWFALPAVEMPKRGVKRGAKAAVRAALRKGKAPARAKPGPKPAPPKRRVKADAETPAAKGTVAKKAAPEKPKAGKKKGGGGSASPSVRADKRGRIKKAKKATAMKPLSPSAIRAAKPPDSPSRRLGTGTGRRGVAAARPTPLAVEPPAPRRSMRMGRNPMTGDELALESAPPKALSPKRSPKKAARRAARKPVRPTPSRRASANGGGATKQAEVHFRAEMDQEVVVDKTVSVDVTIARHALEVAAARAGDTAAATVDTERKLIVQIADRRNFRIDGERRVEIDVPAPDSEANVSFDVTGLVVGDEGELWVQVRQGPVPLVTLKLKPRIVAVATGRAARLPVEHEMQAMPPPEPPLDELLVEESFVGNDVQYRYYLDLPSLKVRKRFESPVIKGRDTYITRILNRIGDAWAGSGKDQLEAFETDLKAIGAAMFTELMPREMQELLWERRGEITSVQVFSMEPFIPWELVYLKDPRNQVIADDSKFLGELGLVRWLYDGYPPAKLAIGSGRARYVIPTYSGENVLPDAAGEEKMMKSLFKATAVRARALDVQKLLRTPGGFDLLHFGGHAEAAGDEQADARLLLDELDDGTTENALLATTVAQTAQLDNNGHRPIVVLNACESARMNRSFASMGGFASAFVSRGAGVFIGTHWSVGDAPARTFIDAFYKSFAVRKRGTKPLELREAVMKARQAARDGGDATWLAYVVYGHPRAVVDR